MVSSAEAVSILQAAFPDALVSAPVEYGKLYICQVIEPDPDEGFMDPFYSVDKATGQPAEFSIFTDADPNEILQLFEKQQQS